ncbi:hypothetical protein HHI36_007718 [Cryptolaemus montrouzieri]|uniref:General transcription factor 3C polypeptide 5 n=1 Tax=Cryptolaemus montrouzieri TaxID=559131 RepID=A0ABD2MQY3_9CUCU
MEMEDSPSQKKQNMKKFTRFLKDSIITHDSQSPNIENIENRENSNEVNPECMYTIKNRLVRIQYPGIVKNLDRALETLGGISGIERAVSSVPNKLQLNFHPENKFNKGCIADCDSSSGLLLKVKIQKFQDKAPKYTYEIVGNTIRNFVFNKLIDFQYLPLVAKYPESAESEVNYIYDSIVLKNLPSLNDALKEDKVNMTLFLPPFCFSRSDNQRKLNPIEKTSPGNVNLPTNKNQTDVKKKCMAFSKQKQQSIFHKFSEPNIPERPYEFVSQLIDKGNYQERLIKLQKFFEERPIWTKNGIKYNTKFSNDILKILLPAVAYYETSGPWRCTWIRFGYDPRKDPTARKFQNLDYRIPVPIRSNLKVGSQRCVSEATTLKRLREDNTRGHKILYNENSYILRPNMLPNSRQVFYQYCDILLPEIQTMLARLPPVPAHTQCDPKNGWFPVSFVDQCREIVNKYVDQQASVELLKNVQESCVTAPSSLENEPKSTDYCSLMIRNVKRGVYKEKNPLNEKIEARPSTSQDIYETTSVTEIVDTDSEEESLFDESFYQELDFEDIEDELDNTDGFLIHEEQESMDIDTDALEDVKSIIANNQ